MASSMADTPYHRRRCSGHVGGRGNETASSAPPHLIERAATPHRFGLPRGTDMLSVAWDGAHLKGPRTDEFPERSARQAGSTQMMAGRALALAGLIAATVAGAGPAGAQQIKLTFADQNSPAGWGPSH